MDVRKIVVVQMDGPIELLASAAAVAGLKKTYPAASITLIVSAKTMELAAFLNAHDIIAANEGVGRLPTLPPETCAETDLLVNLSLSDSSCVVASYFNAQTTMGARWNSEQKISLDDGWTRFYQSINGANGPNDIHLIEVLTSLANAQWTDPDHLLSATNKTKESLKSLLRPHDHIKVAVVPGGVPEEAIKSTIETMYDCGFQIHFYFVGTLRERAAAMRIFDSVGDAKDICSNLAGKTTLAELVELFYLCDIVIGSPGLESIASSGFGTMNICYLDAAQQNHSLLPYGLGHLILQPEIQPDPVMLGALLSEIIAHAITQNNGNMPTPQQWQAFCDGRIEEHIGKIRIHLTAPTSINSEKGTKTSLQLLPLLFSGYTSNDMWREFHRSIWENILDDTETNHNKTDLKEDAITALSSITPSIEALSKACAFGMRYTNSIRDAIIDGTLPTAQEHSAKLQEIDELILSLSESECRIGSFINYFFVNQEQIFDIDPLAVSEKMLLCYTLLSHQAMMVLDLYRKLLCRINEAIAPQDSAPRMKFFEVDANG